MAFGIGNLFDPFKNFGMNLFGGPDKGLMRAGMDDFKPPDPSPPAGVGMIRAVDGPGPAGAPLTPPAPILGDSAPIIGHETPAPGPSTIVTPPGAPGAPGPGQIPTPPGAGESSAPLHPATATTPPGVPAPAPAGGAGATPPAAAGTGPVPTTKVGGQTTLSRLADMGKALGQAGGGAAAKGGSIGSAGGDPAAASRAGSAQLLQSILESHRKDMVGAGPVPGLPAGLLQRFRGG